MIGVAIPQAYPAETGISAEVASFLRSAEAAGCSSAWVSEAPADRSLLDPLTLLCVAAVHTSRLRLGSAVLVLPDYPAGLLARTVASVDRLSGGRLVLGVGAGEGGPPSTPAPSRGERLEAGVALLRAARPSLPILVGARAPVALRRAARIGDGWICSAWVNRRRFAEQRDVVLDELHELGRDTERYRFLKRCYVAVDRRAADVSAWFGLLTGGPPDDDVLVQGDAATVEERLRDLCDAGADGLVVVFAGTDEERQLAALADHGMVERLSANPGEVA